MGGLAVGVEEYAGMVELPGGDRELEVADDSDIGALCKGGQDFVEPAIAGHRVVVEKDQDFAFGLGGEVVVARCVAWILLEEVDAGDVGIALEQGAGAVGAAGVAEDKFDVGHARKLAAPVLQVLPAELPAVIKQADDRDVQERWTIIFLSRLSRPNGGGAGLRKGGFTPASGRGACIGVLDGLFHVAGWLRFIPWGADPWRVRLDRTVLLQLEISAPSTQPDQLVSHEYRRSELLDHLTDVRRHSSVFQTSSENDIATLLEKLSSALESGDEDSAASLWSELDTAFQKPGAKSAGAAGTDDANPMKQAMAALKEAIESGDTESASKALSGIEEALTRKGPPPPSSGAPSGSEMSEVLASLSDALSSGDTEAASSYWTELESMLEGQADSAASESTEASNPLKEAMAQLQSYIEAGDTASAQQVFQSIQQALNRDEDQPSLGTQIHSYA